MGKNTRISTTIKKTILMMSGVMMVFGLFGCKKQAYPIQYDDQKYLWTQPIEEAYPDDTVKLSIPITDGLKYLVMVDQKEISLQYNDETKEWEYEFRMPKHPVQVTLSQIETDDSLEHILYQYRRCTVAVVGETHGTQYTLQKEDEGYVVVVESYDGEESTEKRYPVDEKVYEEILDLCEKNQMEKWKEMDEGEPIDGVSCNILFRNREGKLVMVDLNDEPEQNHGALQKTWKLVVEALEHTTEVQ